MHLTTKKTYHNRQESNPNRLSSDPNSRGSNPNWLSSSPNRLEGTLNWLSSGPNCLSSDPNLQGSDQNQHGNNHNSIALDNADNVFVTGASAGIESTADYATIKYDKNGTFQWVARFDGGANSKDQPNDIETDKDGNVYVTGVAFNGINIDYATIKYDKDGVEQWHQIFDGVNHGTTFQDWDWANDLGIDDDGNVYVTGWSWNGNNFDFATVKYNQPVQLQDLLGLISKHPPVPPVKLRDMLLQASPLPDTVMIAMLKRKAVMPPKFLREVLLVNAPLPDKVLISMINIKPLLGKQINTDILIASIPFSDNLIVGIVNSKIELLPPLTPISFHQKYDKFPDRDSPTCYRFGERQPDKGDGKFRCIVKPSPCCIRIVKKIVIKKGNSSSASVSDSDSVSVFANPGDLYIYTCCETEKKTIIRAEVLEEEIIETTNRKGKVKSTLVITTFDIEKVLQE